MSPTSLLRNLPGLCLFLWLSFSVSAATRTWNGSLNTNWAAAKNWSGSVVPKSGDELVFPAEAANRDNWNQLVASFASVSFTGEYTVGGSPILTRHLIANGAVTINAPVTIQPDAGINATFIIFNGKVIVTGDTHFSGESSTFNGPITGPGRLIAGGLTLRNTNAYTGGTLIRTNSRVWLEAQSAAQFGTLGQEDTPVEIQAGGNLRVAHTRTITQPIRVAGSGFRLEGAIRTTADGARISQPLTLTGDAMIFNERTLAFAGVTAAPEAPDAVFIKAGKGELQFRGVTNQFTVPVLITDGNFYVLPGLLPVGGIRPPVPNTFLRDLTVGSPTNRFPLVCDVFLPISGGGATALPSRVFGPGVAVTVHSNATLIAGPFQQGLGEPLRLDGGKVTLIGTIPRTPPGQHTGEIFATGRTESAIEGWLDLTNEVTIRSTNNAPIRVGTTSDPGQLTGDQLVVDGARLRLLGSAPNKLTNLVIRAGEVTLGKPLSATAAAKTNLVGTDEAGAAPAALRAVAIFQFPALAHVEVRTSGSLIVTQSTSLGRLVVAGGRAQLANVATSGLEVTDGARFQFVATAPPGHSLAINGLVTWTGNASAAVSIPNGISPAAPLTLLKLAGTSPIPGRFDGLPNGGTMTNNIGVYRINYSGGDGNDLVLELVDPTERPKLTLAQPADGSPTISWPESAGCLLEFQPAYDPTGVWTPVTVGPAMDGKFTFVITPTNEQPSGFYRLNCP